MKDRAAAPPAAVTTPALNNKLYHWSLVNGDAETIALMNTQLEDELSQLKYTVFDNYHIAFKAKEWPTISLNPETPLESD